MADAASPPRILVIFYSRTGNTREIARAIARAAGADIEEIEDRRSRRGLFGYLRSGYEAWSNAEPLIRAPQRDPRAYDIVLIGTPTWAGSVASPVRAYLSRQAERLPAVGFFVTKGGSGGEQVLGQMRRLALRDPLGTLILREQDIERAQPVLIGEFVESLLEAWEARSPKLASGASERPVAHPIR
jgi:flavodoxin